MPARKRFEIAYYLPDSSLLALIHNIALSNGYCFTTFSLSHSSLPQRRDGQSLNPHYPVSVSVPSP